MSERLEQYQKTLIDASLLELSMVMLGMGAFGSKKNPAGCSWGSYNKEDKYFSHLGRC
jgi:hypothetical protein